jgi:hypothetical protein
MRIVSRRMIIRWAAVVPALAALAAPAQSQARGTVERTGSGYVLRIPTANGVATQRFPSAARMLADFARVGQQPQLGQVILTGAPFPAALVDSLNGGLAQLALTGANEDVRSAAVSALVFMGKNRRDVTERIVGIYERSRDPRVRGNVLVLLPMTSGRSRAIAFLRTVAVRGGEPQDEPAKAVSSLALLGPEGQAVLRELHGGGLVRSPAARARLTLLARNGYQERGSHQP